jgi:hypothetical protein
MQELRYNTAVRVAMGPIYSNTDGVTPVTSFTTSNEKTTMTADTDDNSAPSAILTAVAGNDGTNTLTQIGSINVLDLKLTGANTSHYGRVTIAMENAAAHCPVFRNFLIISQNEFDAKYGTSVVRPVNSSQVGGQTASAAGAVTFGSYVGNATAAIAVDANGRLDVIKVAGTTQTAKDLGAALPAAAPGANGGLPTTNGTKLNQTVDLTAGQSITASTVTAGVTLAANQDVRNVSGTLPNVTLANGAHGGAAATLTLNGAAGLVTTKIDAAFNGNLSGSVGSVTNGVTVAVGGIVAGANAAAELNAIADSVLDRNMATGTDSGTDTTVVRTPRQALRVLRNKRAIAAGVLTVRKEDDATSSWTASVATAASDPVNSIDPS